MDGGHDRASDFLARSTDVLSDVLEVVRLHSALFFVVDVTTPWVADAPAAPVLAPAILPRLRHVVSYHVVTSGACWCRIPGGDSVRLEAGDVVVIPHGDAYVLSSAPELRSGAAGDQTLAWFREMAAGRLPFVIEEGGGGPSSLQVLCGFLGCDAAPFNPVLSTLPALVHIPRPREEEARLAQLTAIALAETRDRRAGARSMLLRVGELLFLEVVRRYLTALPDASRGWLAGLRDPIAGRALALLHERPHAAWTLDALAREIGSSRSIVADRFTHLVGESPMHYLARWRMQVAARLLADETAKVADVAARVGYESEAAFSRAFKRATGVAPATWRRGHAAGGDTTRHLTR